MLVVRFLCRHPFTVRFRYGFECTSTNRLQSHGFVNDAPAPSLKHDNIIERKGHRESPFIYQIRQMQISTSTLSQFALNNVTACKEFLRPGKANTIFLQKRHKSWSSKKDKQVEKNSESDVDEDDDDDRGVSDSDDDSDDDDVKPKGNDKEKVFPDVHFPGDAKLASNYKMMKRKLSQPRYDSVYKLGFKISSKQFLNDLSEQRCSLNGLPLKLKRTPVKSGDVLDAVINDDKIKRIRVVSLETASSNHTNVCLKVWKAPFSKSLVEDLE